MDMKKNKLLKNKRWIYQRKCLEAKYNKLLQKSSFTQHDQASLTFTLNQDVKNTK